LGENFIDMEITKKELLLLQQAYKKINGNDKTNIYHKIETICNFILNKPNVTEPLNLFEFIVDNVCNYFNIDKTSIYSNSRKSEIVKARHVCMYLFKMHTNMSLQRISFYFNKTDHTTVSHAINCIEKNKDTFIHNVIDNMEIKIKQNFRI